MATLKYYNPNLDTWIASSGNVLLGSDIPVGVVLQFSGKDTMIPDGFLICDGSSLLRTDYPDLFNVIGTTYGSADNTHFNLPNIKGKTIVSLDSNDNDFNKLGKTVGEKIHSLTTDELPSMDVHMTKNAWFDKGGLEAGGAANRRVVAGGATGGDTSYIIGTVNGGNQPHNNIQPSFVQYTIIKAKKTSYNASKVIDNLDSNSSTDALSANQGRILNNAILNNSSLVSTYVLQDDSNIFTMSGLDIDRDGGIYDIYMQFQADSENDFAFGVRINGADSTTYNYSGVASNKDGSTFTNVYGKNANAFRLGAKRGNFVGFVKFTITKAAYSLSPRFMISSTSYSSGINSEFINGVFEPGEETNLTSLQFLNTTNNNNFIKTGTKIFVYKK